MFCLMFVALLSCATVLADDPVYSSAETEDTNNNRDHIATYWEQFGVEHFAMTPIEDYLAEREEDLLWQGILSGMELRVFWDAILEIVSVEVADEDDFVGLDDLVMIEVPSSRPAWEASFNNNGIPELSGFVDVDELNQLIVLEITVRNISYRMFSMDFGQEAKDNMSLAVASMTSCKCFGKGTSTKTCTNSDCDTGESCGAERACRWVANKVPQ